MIKGKILTIDDEPDFVMLIKNYFSIRGYEVFTALRGVVGLEIVEKEKPNVIFVDLKLPGIDGDQILEQIQRIHPKAKTIMITAFKDDGQTRRRVLAAGVYAYFEKPIASFKDLENTVGKAIEGDK
ncbi:response regulator [Omnitrophica bacterium]|nr:response regulator [Candidatus Omnitrophota bacterium]